MTDGPGSSSDRGQVSLTGIAQALATSLVAAHGTAAADVMAPPMSVSGVTLDSRRVVVGDLYAALPGAHRHGADFAAQAAAAGAVAALTDPGGAARVLAAGLPAVVVADPRAVLGDVSALIYGHPGTALTTIGITGTNGKTTTAYLLDAVLRAAGCSTGLMGTVETRIAGRRVPSVRTTPEAPDLHSLLAQMVDAGVQACALEVSSHALSLHRVDGLVVDVAVFTNLSQDHLDFHSSMEDYFAAKASLFTPAHARHGVVAVDSPWGRRLSAAATVPVTTVLADPGATDPGATGADASHGQTSEAGADWTVTDVHAGRTGATFALRPRRGTALQLTCPIPGDFNVANAALAAVAALQTGLSAEAVSRGLAAAEGVPGRMQWVVPPGAADAAVPMVVVDYAHTPDAIQRVLHTLRAGTPGRLVIVLGAGGDRDRAKRGVMGSVAAQVADLLVVTDDNPRSEDPAAVRAAVLAGVRPGRHVLEVADRRAAIAAALAACAGPHDTVLIAGKGHETGQEVAGVVAPFDDREVAAHLLTEWRRTRLVRDPKPVGGRT